MSGKYAAVVRNVRVARPSCSTSGGHPSGGSSGRDDNANFDAGEPFARADMTPVTDWNEDVALDEKFDLSLFGFGGFQYRNAVQILHGFPSGPRTIPGGSVASFFGASLSPAAVDILVFFQGRRRKTNIKVHT